MAAHVSEQTETAVGIAGAMRESSLHPKNFVAHGLSEGYWRSASFYSVVIDGINYFAVH